jgi:signal peptidase I
LRRLLHRLPAPLRITVDWVVTVGAAVAIVLALRAWVISPYRIPSSSMEPTLHCTRLPGCLAKRSDRVLAFRLMYRFREPRRGDIVVFRATPKAEAVCGGGEYVKRLIGLPGETWSEKNGYVYIDGRRIDEPYLDPKRRDRNSHGAVEIPEGRYFFMGDNRTLSCDSRRWGTVPRKDLIGPVSATYWPPRRISIR